jgi:murein DD-endopeptidase MepM/ murein hydrolase activator NlpD
MMRRYITALMLACCIGGYGQEKKQVTFVPPFDFPLTLSGNFGEIRSNHFHGGLDFKTGGVIGKPVRALADGYISRIRVTNGSGYVLDVCYHNGYSTINRHLSGFVSPIAERVEKLQYEEESWEVEIVPEPGEFPVKGGQQIAWSGNTGYSFGPHLHLDVFETESGDYIDPMPFFQSKIKDTRAPKADGILFFPQLGKGVVDGKQENKTILPNSERPVEDSKTTKGMFAVHQKKNDYYFEIPTSLLGRDLLVVNKLQRVPAELNDAGVNRGVNYENQMVCMEWDKATGKLMLRQQRPLPLAPQTDAIFRSVKDNFISPLIAAFKIEAVNADSTAL